MTGYTQALERMLLEADALVKAGRFAEGEARAREVLAAQPRNAGGHYILGMSALMQERHGDCLAHMESALRNDRVNAQYHFLAALAQAGLKRVDDAIASYRRALQYQPGFLEAKANMAYLHEHAGRPGEAAQCYRQVLEQHPREWFCLNRLAYCERNAGRPEEALALLLRALELRPEVAATHNELALCHLQMGRNAEAIASLRATVQAEPGFAEGWANLAKLLYVEHLEAMQRWQRGEGAAPDKAPVIACFDRLLTFDPANAEFKYLRDSLAGVQVDRPPDRYIESFFDRFAAQFEARVVGELRYSAPAKAAQFLAPWLEGRSALRVVDLGCGTGLSGGFLRGHAASLVGVDLSAAMLGEARARGGYDELVQGEIGDYLGGRDAGSADVIIALDVFIYVGALERVVHAAAAALAPGGILAFSVEEAADSGNGFVLHAAGRYAHAPAYVTGIAQRAGLRLLGSEPFAIRHEAGAAVAARMFAFGKD